MANRWHVASEAEERGDCRKGASLADFNIESPLQRCHPDLEKVDLGACSEQVLMDVLMSQYGETRGESGKASLNAYFITET